MNASKWTALVLIIAGVLALAYGSFSYTKETHDARIGPLKLSVKDTETVNIPAWLGVLHTSCRGLAPPNQGPPPCRSAPFS